MCSQPRCRIIVTHHPDRCRTSRTAGGAFYGKVEQFPMRRSPPTMEAAGSGPGFPNLVGKSDDYQYRHHIRSFLRKFVDLFALPERREASVFEKDVPMIGGGS